MIIADLNALRAPLDALVISGETASHVDAVVEDLISAVIAQDAFHKALPALANLPAYDAAEFDYAARTPHVFAQAWVRSLRDVAEELLVLAEDPVTSDAAHAAAIVFVAAFPGLGRQAGALRVMSADVEEVYFAVGPARYPVRIDDAAVRDLESVVRTLVDALPKEKPFRAVG